MASLRPHQGSLEQLGSPWEPLPESPQGPAVACVTQQTHFLLSVFWTLPSLQAPSTPVSLRVETKSS